MKQLVRMIMVISVVSMMVTGCSTLGGVAQSSSEVSVEDVVREQLGDASEQEPVFDGEIILLGEIHAVEAILDEELMQWQTYYNEGNRDLMVEQSYYTAELLNRWMKADDDVIFDKVYAEWEGSMSHNQVVYDFYQKLKATCPDTVFHGTDVGHQFDTTGQDYLEMLESEGLTDSYDYERAQLVIEQGKRYYADNSDGYRENRMTENFIEALKYVTSNRIVGIYGCAHTNIESLDYTENVPCMANQLYNTYGLNIQEVNLAYLELVQEPLEKSTLVIRDKTYEVSYFGRADLTGFKDYKSREFWRIEDAYEDFKDLPLTGDYLPYDNYIMPVEEGQVFKILYTYMDDTTMTLYYRSDGKMQGDKPITQGIDIQ